MNKPLIIVTGASSGIGEAVAESVALVLSLLLQ